MQIHIDHEFRCGVDTFWDKVFFDVDYNRRLFVEGLHFKTYEQMELADRGDAMFRRIRGIPPSEIPATVQRVIGADMSYVEELTFDKKSRKAVFKNIPARMADKINIEGTISAVPNGPNRMRRIVDLDLQAKFFGVGRLVEKFAAGAFKDNFEKAATWTNRWLAEVGLEDK